MQPLFVSGQKVKHLGAHAGKPNRRVTVLECISEPGEAIRYYVRHKGHIWSVPEAYLRAK